MLNELNINHFGPIKEAHLRFGDLTVLIGAQASGKSLCLQLMKLLLDKRYVAATMDKYNYVIAKNPDNILNFYFGDGLAKMWTEETVITDGVNIYKKSGLLGKGNPNAQEQLFYIPAQRIISISDGRPKNFMEYDSSTPFVLRQFSETLRMFFQYGLFKPLVNHKLQKPTTLRQFIPPMFFAGLIAGGLLSFFSRTIMWLFVSVIALYVLCCFIFGRNQERVWPDILWMPFTYATIHLSYGCGYWVGILKMISHRKISVQSNH